MPNETRSTGRQLTVADVCRWLASLPAEYQNAPFESMVFHVPCALKRVVAYQTREGGRAVVCNPMGTHLPFDGSLKWEATLTTL
jgi:hypothetical protein